MGYDYQKWRSRMSDRQDLSSSLVHLTRGAESLGTRMTPVDILLKILREETIIGSTPEKGFIRGSRSAVCFQDAPLYSIAQNLKFEKELRSAQQTRHRYSGCGLVFSKFYLFQQGCRPVIYDVPDQGKRYIAESELYRLVALDLTDKTNMVDWSHEREWRMPGNFKFRVDWSAVLLETITDYREFVAKSPRANLGILKGFVELWCLTPF